MTRLGPVGNSYEYDPSGRRHADGGDIEEFDETLEYSRQHPVTYHKWVACGAVAGPTIRWAHAGREVTGTKLPAGLADGDGGATRIVSDDEGKRISERTIPPKRERA